MSRIKETFNRKKGKILNIYCTAGFPELNDTMNVLQAIQDGGADLIELGLPYSDPLADGPVIQASSARSLENGMSISTLFGQLSQMRERIQVPVILMGYLNPILQYGFEAFCSKAAERGVDGLIIPDLPMLEFENVYGRMIKAAGLDFIFLVTPETSEERIKKLDSLSSGFLYAVSSSSLTGALQGPGPAEDYLARLRSLGLKNPVLVGFGISDRKGFEAACNGADGAIIGSAYIRALEQPGSIKEKTMNFISGILGNNISDPGTDD